MKLNWKIVNVHYNKYLTSASLLWRQTLSSKVYVLMKSEINSVEQTFIKMITNINIRNLILQSTMQNRTVKNLIGFSPLPPRPRHCVVQRYCVKTKRHFYFDLSIVTKYPFIALHKWNNPFKWVNFAKEKVDYENK